MSDIFLSDLLTGVTIAEAKSAVYGILAELGVSTSGWKKSSVLRTMVSLFSVVFSSISQVVALVAGSGFRTLATGDWLTLTAREVYNVNRRDATFATGTLTLINAGGGVFSEPIGTITFQNPTTGKLYTNAEAISLSALSTQTIDIVALEAGSESSCAIASVTTIVTTMSGVTCSNPTALAGEDEETDAELRVRCDEKIDALSPDGPAGAYGYFAKVATRADGTLLGITRTTVNANSTTGEVDVYVADADGTVSASDLAIANLSIQQNAVPLGITCTVYSATPKLIPVEYSIYVYENDSRSSAELQGDIELALDAWISDRPIGGDSGYVDRDALKSVLFSVSPYIYKAVLSTPSSNVAIASTEVPILGTVTCSGVTWTEARK